MAGKTNWVDIEENDVDEDDTYVPPPEVIEDDKAGTKTVIEYRIEPNGQKVKVVTKYKIVTKTKRVSRSVAERAKWSKFGKSVSGNDAQTIVSRDDVKIEDPREGEENDKKANEAMLLRIAQKMQETKEARERQERLGLDPNAARKGGLYNPAMAQNMGAEGDVSIGGTGAGGKYVPPSMRGGVTQGKSDNLEESTTLRVTNISEDAQERDLKDLFEKFGHVPRIYLAKDKETGQSRGFAYVTYIRREDAENAKSALDGYGYDHLILKVEWAEKSEKREDFGGGSGMKFASGYGKSLPQG